VSNEAVLLAIRLLSTGPAPDGKTMRGAVILDAVTAERIEPDQERGVRASRFDWNEVAFHKISADLAAAGLTHYRTREALALATKVAHAPGVVAELCWSDDPDYTAGYLASLRTGYVRFPCLKKAGDPKGGRVIFIDRSDLKLDELLTYLRSEPVLITNVGLSPKELNADYRFDVAWEK
jgi:6-carboxyhexanoate--CoA ligase